MDFGLDYQSTQKELVTFKEMGVPREILPNVHYPIATPIQRKVIPKLLRGEDTIAISRTGSGKTFAYVIPILMRLLEKKEKKSIYTRNKAIIIVPTYELAVQVSSVFQHLSSGGVHPALFTGIGSLAHTFNYLVVGHFEVAICTPGRLEHLFLELTAADKTRPIYVKAEEDGVKKEVCIDTVQLLEKIANPDVIVVDEMDRIFEDKSLSLSLARILAHFKGSPQYALFSATHHRGNLHLRTLLGRTEMEVVEIIGGVSEHLEHGRLSICNLFVQEEVKLSLLISLYKRYLGQKMLVFVSTCRRAAFISSVLRKIKASVAVLSSLEAEEARGLSVKEFKSGEISVLVSTDVGCRGLDIKGISAIVEYDYSPSRSTAVHRVGRMNRGRSEQGILFSFIRAQDLPCYFSFLNHIYSEVPRDSARKSRLCFSFEKCSVEDGHRRCCYLGLGRVPSSVHAGGAEAASSVELDPFFHISYSKYTKTNPPEKIDPRWVVSHIDTGNIPAHPFFGGAHSVEEAIRAYRPRKEGKAKKTRKAPKAPSRKPLPVDLEKFKDPFFIPYEGGNRICGAKELPLGPSEEAEKTRAKKMRRAPGEAFSEWKKESRARLSQGHLLQRNMEKTEKTQCKTAEGIPYSVRKVAETRKKREEAFKERREKNIQKRKRSRKNQE